MQGQIRWKCGTFVRLIRLRTLKAGRAGGRSGGVRVQPTRRGASRSGTRAPAARCERCPHCLHTHRHRGNRRGKTWAGKPPAGAAAAAGSRKGRAAGGRGCPWGLRRVRLRPPAAGVVAGLPRGGGGGGANRRACRIRTSRERGYQDGKRHTQRHAREAIPLGWVQCPRPQSITDGKHDKKTAVIPDSGWRKCANGQNHAHGRAGIYKCIHESTHVHKCTRVHVHM